MDINWSFGVVGDELVKRAKYFENFCSGSPLDFSAFLQILQYIRQITVFIVQPSN